MKQKLFRAFRSPILVVLHPGSGAPIALRVNARKLVLWGTVFTLLLMAGSLGTILFFREVEVSRRLIGRLAEVETENLLTRLSNPAVVPVVSAKPSIAPLSVAVKEGVEKSVAIETPTERAAASEVVSQTAPAHARIRELDTQCAHSGKCSVTLSLVPAGNGIAQGKVVVILESEVPRIGGAQTNTPSPGAVRKRYVIYPGGESKDEISIDQISKLEGKSFRFSRILQTSADFTFSPVLRPLAVNVYVFDAQNTLAQHERRVIELEER